MRSSHSHLISSSLKSVKQNNLALPTSYFSFISCCLLHCCPNLINTILSLNTISYQYHIKRHTTKANCCQWLAHFNGFGKMFCSSISDLVAWEKKINKNEMLPYNILLKNISTVFIEIKYQMFSSMKCNKAVVSNSNSWSWEIHVLRFYL